MRSRALKQGWPIAPGSAATFTPGPPPPTPVWILETGAWNDNGVWDDTAMWKDVA